MSPISTSPRRTAIPHLHWLLVAVWMGMIYALSGPEFAGAKTDPTIAAQVQSAAPRLDRHEVRQATYFLRKHAHVAVYALLGLLLAGALSGFPPRRPTLRSAAGLLLLVAVIAALDEWHQTFVPGRYGRVADVFWDLLGAALALGTLRLLGRKPAPAQPVVGPAPP